LNLRNLLAVQWMRIKEVLKTLFLLK